MLYLTYQVYTMDVSKSGTNQTASFTSGFLMQFLNPKVVLFTLTVIPSYVMPYYTAGPVISAFVVAVSLIGLSAYTTWAVCGSLFKELCKISENDQHDPGFVSAVLGNRRIRHTGAHKGVMEDGAVYL